MAGDDAGEDDDHEGQQRQETRQHHALPALVHALGRKDPLDERLVVRPEIDARYRHADQDAQPGRRRIVQGADQFHGQVAGSEQAGKILSAAARETGHREDDGSQDQDHGLDQLRIDGRRESARDGIGGGQQGENQDDELQVGLREQEFDDEGGGIERARRIQEDAADDADRGEKVTGTLVETFLQELRDGEDPGFDVQGQQERGEKDHDHDAGQVVVEHGDARVIRIPALPDEGRGRDAGRKQRQPHHPPGHGAAGQEIGARIATFSVTEYPPDDEYEIQDDDGYVDPSD